MTIYKKKNTLKMPQKEAKDEEWNKISINRPLQIV